MAQKRGNNEGSIHKRKNGNWRAQVYLDGQRLSFSSTYRRECHEWLKKTLHQIDGGLTLSGAQTTLEIFLNNWLESIQSSLRPGTFYQYQMTCRKHIVPTLGNILCADRINGGKKAQRAEINGASKKQVDQGRSKKSGFFSAYGVCVFVERWVVYAQFSPNNRLLFDWDAKGPQQLPGAQGNVGVKLTRSPGCS